jgi:hypothetical protein
MHRKPCWWRSRRAPFPEADWLAAWGNPAAVEHRGKKYFQGQSHSYRFADSAVVIAPGSIMRQILEIDGPPLLRAGIERLVAASDEGRHVNLLFTPNYLLGDGKSLLSGQLAALRPAIRDFLDERIEAVLVSAHVGDELYLEFRAVAPVDRKPLELLELLRSRWNGVPDRVEAHVASLALGPHGRLVVNRFPRMVQLARDFTRGGIEDSQVVMNAYLPRQAAHNLAMGVELALLETAGVGSTATAVARPAETKSIAGALQRKISLSFPRESLEAALAALAKELGIAIEIRGADLQLEGITRNQSLSNVDERDQNADSILRKLLTLANPDGKLVYVIQPSPRGGETIVITTRQAATKRGDRLPDGF